MHAKWLAEFYNQITSEASSKLRENGWKASGVYDFIEITGFALPPLDPFQDFLPLVVADDDDDARGISIAFNVLLEVKEGFVNIIEDVDEGNGEEF